MEAVILAGGLGSRLRDAVPDGPKPMAPVAGRPFLELVLRALAEQGITRAVVAVGYMADRIVSHFGDTFLGVALAYEVEEVPAGTGGAVRRALARCKADHAVIWNGDTYLDVDLAALDRRWLRDRVPLIVGRTIEDTTRYGRLVTDGDRVLAMVRGVPGPGLINAGCYVMSREALRGVKLADPFSFEDDFLTPEVQRGTFHAIESTGLFIDIGVPEDYRRAQRDLAGLAARCP